MKIFIFGNPDLKIDSLPLRILPELKKQFPNVSFEFKDPNEEWDISGDITIIDTVIGSKDPAVYEDLDKFKKAPHLTMHDFDAYANLRLLKKIGKLNLVKIYGLPPDFSEKDAVAFLKTSIKVEGPRTG